MVDPVPLGLQALFTLQTSFDDFTIDIDVGQGLLGSGISAFVTTLVIGAILIAVVPEFLERMMAEIEAEPVDSLVYGLVALVGLAIVIILLAITIIGILIVIPLALLAVLVWAVGAAIAYLLIGERLVGREDGWLKPLLVGAGINGLLTVSGIGGLLSLCIGAAGFGAIIRDWRSK